MLSNYIKIAFRNIVKYKFYSFLNVFGLAVGLATALFVMLYVFDELSYDRFHQKHENIYRVALHGRIGGQEVQTSSSSPPVAFAMVHEIPGVEQATRLDPNRRMAFRFGDKAFFEEFVFGADSNFFEFFSFPLAEGDPATALREPHSVVLTHALAKKYFGDEPALGKLMTLGSRNETYKVTGIVEKAPTNSHIQYNALLSNSTFDFLRGNGGWTNNGIYTYIRKNPSTRVDEINGKLQDIVEARVGAELQEGLGIDFKKFREQGGIYSYWIYPMTDTRLYMSYLQDEIRPNSDIKYVYIFSAIGIFILVIACINFMNLSTARSANRAKEVGMRKTLGSLRSQMVGQFISESVLYAWVSALLAVVIAYLLLPSFNMLAGKELVLSSIFSLPVMAGILVLVVVVGLLAGSYPAFYLTSFKAIDVMRGKIRAGMKSGGIRSALVVFQFMISIVLIICTLIGYQQVKFLQSRDMGLDRNQVIVVNQTNLLGTNQRAFKEEILKNAAFPVASFSDNSFPGVNQTTVFKSGDDSKDHILAVNRADVDNLDVLKYKLTAGRFFSRDFPSDSSAVVLNEAAVKEMGWADPIGKEIIDLGNEQGSLRVVGVVKDFNFDDIRQKVRPMIMVLVEQERNLYIRYNSDAGQAVKAVTDTWKKFAASEPLSFTFLDQNFDSLFRSEQRISQIILVFTIMAIVIACLGLFGLAAFSAEQRTKEIGVRKVMGASVVNLTTLLSREFTILVVVAFALAVVPAYWLIDQWLSGFAYRIDPGAAPYFIGGISALAIAWITVSYQSVKAAVSNPVESLRNE